MRLTDRLIATFMHAAATWTVCYGDNLRFAGDDLPAPRRVRVPSRHGSVPVWVYQPSSPARTAHVHFHGGAWLMRFPGMDDWWCRYLAATAKVTVLNVDFRTGPYVTYPVAQHQCHDVAEWAASGGGDLHLGPISVGGFSSGGGLAASVCLQARDAGRWLPTLQVLGVPALDLATDPVVEERGRLSVELRRLVRRVYFPDPATRTHPYASPVLAPSLAGLPPAIVLTAEHDVLRHDGRRYVARLREAGVPVIHDETPGVDHYFLTENPVRARATMAMVAAKIAETAR
ncbi:alpha/beta hydrolase fold domain-containing protein [Kutzneria chonburiensis]|uniref:Alpha/beta hydrolase fold domain-containing protein n=1 Tax=Kutzneria chonburiensis TaxID=1483604 RepID=A0ABV6N1B4_9PSEU|nr:alpha/beta hydrolase fold domain-containing protein [Kutzneria chonburiensis]